VRLYLLINKLLSKHAHIILDNDDADLSSITRSASAVSLVLIDCLAQLPEPLLTFAKYDSFLITECILDKKEKIKWHKKLVEGLHASPPLSPPLCLTGVFFLFAFFSELPPSYLNMTTQLMTLLHRLKLNSISNKLHTSTLVNIFYSVFLRPKIQVAYQKNDAVKAQAIFKDLLEEYTGIFGVTPTPQPCLCGRLIQWLLLG